LQADPNPRVRAAALTPAVAAQIIEEPARETSWLVRGRAAHLMRVPFWKLEPKQPWQPGRTTPEVREPISLRWPPPRQPRCLGPNKIVVSAMGISGHYGLPVEGFVRAVEAGVNLLFWEPNYQTLTEFSGRLSSSDRHALHFIAGTFEADGKRVRQDVERALRLLKLDRLSLFLVFWVQGWNRITAEVRDELELLKDTGKIASFGLSTHARPLAVEAMEAGWDPVMVRHSAAHRGAEEKVLPRALELGTSIITFNNTCYGRLLKPQGDQPPPATADYYRYTMAHPAVTVCLSAPSTLEQLDENLAALHDPALPEERRQQLLRHGAAVYQEDTTFRKLVRSL
jgi:diketogulonate reductase-like aldo/keto reductase